MTPGSPLSCFVEEWVCYLEAHGHCVTQPPNETDPLLSYDRQGRHYRWLLRCEDDDFVLLLPADRKRLRSQARMARRAGEWCYLAVKFGHPAGKAVVLPAKHACHLKRLCSSMGGIPWEC
jgi:hypothetical protein